VSDQFAPASECAVFLVEKEIRFHHCDPAGIVFYPQYFVLFHEVMEDWFSIGLDTSYPDLVNRQRVGAPMGRLDCEFLAPSRLGDRLQFALTVTKIGTSSISFRIEVRSGLEVRARSHQTVVLASLAGPPRAVPITEGLRARMERYRAPASQSPPVPG
jgi:4-hydroxybenzoyl-CoA thioesterase